MSKNKNKRDIISEQEFNVQMIDASTEPEVDSPGDSEDDAGSEFLMGLNYMPNEKNEFEGEGDEPGEIVFSDEKSTSPSEVPSGAKPSIEKSKSKIIEKAKVVSSDLPSPWSDLDTDSDTH